MGAVPNATTSAEAAAEIVVFCPTPILTVTIEASASGAPELHLHAGGQGFWVARMAARLGGNVALCAPFGHEAGRILRHLIADEMVQVKGVEIAGTSGSYVHDRRGGERVEICRIPGASLTRHECDDLYNATFVTAMNAQLVVLTGQYPEPVVPTDVFRRLAHDAQANGRQVIADLSGSDLEAAMQAGVEWLCFSHEELVSHGLASSDTPKDLIAGMRNLHQRGAQQVVLHRGADPTFVLLKEQMLEVMTPVVEPLDTCGGGDTFFAALAIGLARRKPVEEAIRFAAAAGTLNVTRRGLGTGNLDDIEQLSGHVQVRPLDQSETIQHLGPE
jgi:1-phosphofructokinase